MVKLLPAKSMAEIRVCSVTLRRWMSKSWSAMASSMRDVWLHRRTSWALQPKGGTNPPSSLLESFYREITLFCVIIPFLYSRYKPQALVDFCSQKHDLTTKRGGGLNACLPDLGGPLQAVVLLSILLICCSTEGKPRIPSEWWMSWSSVMPAGENRSYRLKEARQKCGLCAS